MPLRRKYVLVGIFVVPIIVPALFFVFRLLIHPVHGRSQCERNLEMIHAAEETWASRTGHSTNAIPTWNDLKEELDRDAVREGWTNGRPTCPQGGTYILTPVGEYPKCSIGGPGHSIPVVHPSSPGK